MVEQAVEQAVDVADFDLHETVFDDNGVERRSWKFCNFTLPRSEVVFFCQIIIVTSLIVFSCVNLCMNQKCEETQVWIAVLSSAVGYILPNPKL